MSTVQHDTIRNAMLDGLAVSVFNTGHIRIYSSTPTLLAELDFPADAFPGSAASGSITSGTVVAEASAPNTGTADHVDLDDSGDNTQLLCTVGIGSNEFQFTGGLTISEGDEVSLSGNTMTLSFS